MRDRDCTLLDNYIRASVQSLGILISTKVIVLGHHIQQPNGGLTSHQTSLASLRTCHSHRQIYVSDPIVINIGSKGDIIIILLDCNLLLGCNAEC